MNNKLSHWLNKLVPERPRAEIDRPVDASPRGRPNAQATISTGTVCPYCNSADFVKRGIRQKKHEAVQLYLCRAENCGRTFTAERVKGKRFPLNVILEGISYYNVGLTLEQTCHILKEKFAPKGQTLNPNPQGLTFAPTPATLASWVEEYKPICRFERMRPYAEARTKTFHLELSWKKWGSAPREITPTQIKL